MQFRPTISTNIPSDPDRHVRAAVKAATTAAAEEHYRRSMASGWHFENFAIAKYGYRKRSPGYLDLRERLKSAGMLAGDVNQPLLFTGKTLSEIKAFHQVRATGTRGASLVMKVSLMGANTGRVLDIDAIQRMLNDARKAHDHPRLMRLLGRLKKNGGKLTSGQEQAIARHAELTAISGDELKHQAKIEEQVFHREIGQKLAMRVI